jgi:hypothetical protein
MRIAFVPVLLLLCAWQRSAAPIVLTSDDVQQTYHGAPPEGVSSGRRWLGLFLRDSGPDTKSIPSQLQRTTIRIVAHANRPVHNIVATPSMPLLLLSNVPRLTPGPGITVAQFGNLREQLTLTYELGKTEYELRLEANAPDFCDATVSLRSGKRSQRLFDMRRPARADAHMACDDPLFMVHWAGDLDRDAQLDLVATFTRKYTMHPRLLFLSSAAQRGELVAQVARYDGIGD